MARLQRGESDIREALQVQPDNAEVEGLLDEQVGLADKLLLVGKEREQHPDRENVFERELGRQKDDENVLGTKEKMIDGDETDIRPL